MDDLPLWVPFIFFGIAVIYSLFGFGGGSSYLAVLVLFGFSYQKIPSMALACNLIVAGTAFYQFMTAGHFDFKKILPFIILSIPMAYVGSSISISKEIFSCLLGVSLFFVALRMVLSDADRQPVEPSNQDRWTLGLFSGGAIGFLSGLIGIGGGIFLSPLLMLIRWADAKQAAAAASFFIFVNSLSGLMAHMQKSSFSLHLLLPLMAAVFTGGLLGSRLGAYHLPKIVLQRLMAAFVFYASMKLLRGAL